MTDREKLEKIKRLADDMYYKMAYLTSDTRPIRKAMEDYHSFIIHEYNKDEQADNLSPYRSDNEVYIDKDFEAALAKEWKGYNDRGAAKVDALEDNTQELAFAKGFYRGWYYKKENMVKND